MNVTEQEALDCLRELGYKNLRCDDVLYLVRKTLKNGNIAYTHRRTREQKKGTVQTHIYAVPIVKTEVARIRIDQLEWEEIYVNND